MFSRREGAVLIQLLFHNLTQLLAAYGYWAVIAVVAVESMGVPLPGEATLLTAAIYAGATHRLSVLLVVAAAACGAIVGDNVGYLLGRLGGYRLLRRYGRYIRLDERRLKLGQYLFMRYGGPVVFFGRFVAVLRIWAAFLAGSNRMPWGRFLAFNALGGIVWATLYGFGAYALGQRIHQISGPVGIGAVAIGLAAVIAGWLYLRRHEQRLLVEAEHALPGPLDAHRPDAYDTEQGENAA